MKGSVLNKRIISLLLSAALLTVTLFSAGCTKRPPQPDDEDFITEETEEEEEEPVPGGSLAVPYTTADSLNPFYCKSVTNSSLMSLIFRSLYYPDSSYVPVRDIAESESLKGQILEVRLTNDLDFSDGSPITAQDVKYSFDCAKKSVCYAQVLRGINTCLVNDSFNLTFELEHPDINVLNALYFPIVKRGSATTETSLPIGSGYYRFTQDGIRLSLSANMKYAGKIPEVGTIRLVDTVGNEVPEHLVDTGEIDFFYSDLADANTNRVYSSVTNVYLNNLVYIGVNSDSPIMGLTDLKQAFSYALNRQAICENAFRGFARAAVLPFNISWKELSVSQFAASLSLGGDPAKAEKMFAERGIGKDLNPATVNLICSDSNSFIRNAASLIASALEPYNVIVNVMPMSPAKLEDTVKNGVYDLYIAELKIPANMDLTEFFTPDGAAVWGMKLDQIVSDDMFFKYRNGEVSMDEFLEVFWAEMPFIPLCFRNGRFCYTRDITSDLSATENRIYGGIPEWTYAS